MRLILKSREMEVLVPSGGFGGQHLGLYSPPNRMPRLQFGSSTKMLNATHTKAPRVINVDKNAAYPKAIDSLKASEMLPETGTSTK